ncbi:hypothetical protein BAMA_14660 [Bacillus manliponensis]|uniref:Methyltransferase FkbM domain-containing protein n=1 Tax=Bacillus manliponensis TaxID=574376 RepID=A0A073KEA8_9BACI|nr:FkbM family methyltransferase [Bacillus manliponensis]KEK20648.1 hypothetical protein BAMA_14660 [Bacillus manliponensis]
MFHIINKKQILLQQKQHLFQRLYNPSTPIYIMGKNHYTDQLLHSFSIEGITVNGIIDDYTSKKNHKNIPIYKLSEINPTSLIVVCVLDGKLITALNHLKVNRFSHILTYFDLVSYNKEKFPQVNFCKNNEIDIETNIEQYKWLYNTLDDDFSRQTLLHITDFRYNFDPTSLEFFSYKLHEQYFDVFDFNEKEVFVDCGAYDGQTTKQFITLNPSYEAVHVFEPSPNQYKTTKGLLEAHSNVHVYPFATYNQSINMIFNNDSGSASGISNEGGITVETARLDDIIHERVTYIKLDVEGAEYETLIGAEQLIKTYKPKLAVCVYHNQEDFWRIPQLILQYNPSYRILLRHYTEGFLETVMYFT